MNETETETSASIKSTPSPNTVHKHTELFSQKQTTYTPAATSNTLYLLLYTAHSVLTLLGHLLFIANSIVASFSTLNNSVCHYLIFILTVSCFCKLHNMMHEIIYWFCCPPLYLSFAHFITR